MYICFADDSQQQNPSRKGMGSLIAMGGISIPMENLQDINKGIDGICDNFGFPPDEEFKWSPSRNLWMSSNLQGDDRIDFFLCILDLLLQKQAVAWVMVEDKNSRPANWRSGVTISELDVVTLFLERVNQFWERQSSTGLIIADRPGGNRRSEDKFLSDCSETIQKGTTYVSLNRMAHNVLSTSSKLSRLLQAADLVTSCTLAFVSGETKYAPPVFEAIRPLFDSSITIGGCGLKIHPDIWYVNLYHWLLGDSDCWKMGGGFGLPLKGYPYASDAFTP